MNLGLNLNLDEESEGDVIKIDNKKPFGLRLNFDDEESEGDVIQIESKKRSKARLGDRRKQLKVDVEMKTDDRARRIPTNKVQERLIEKKRYINRNMRREKYINDEDKDKLNRLFDKAIDSYTNDIKECKHTDKVLGRGAFGAVYKMNDKIARKIQKIKLQSTKIAIEKLELYLNLCINLNSFYKEFTKHFPHNIIEVTNCKLCHINGEPHHSYDMSYMKHGILGDLMKKDPSKARGVIVQLLYISSFLETNTKIFHSDLKPDNVMLDIAPNNITYRGLGDIEIKVKKGELIPIVVDFDLSTSNKQLRPAKGPAIWGDTDYFIDHSPNYFKKDKKFISPSHKKVADKLSKFKSFENDKSIEFCNLLQVISPSSQIVCRLKGGKKRKSVKKIRKHTGINQQTGRLKKGYKYSGKKLKSGLSEIKKIRKKR